MLTTPDLRLKCLIEDEVTVFPVDVACNDEVSDLKKLIQKERAQDSLKDVGPYPLELWKPRDSNPIAAKADTLAKRIRDLGPDFSKFADKLDPSEIVFSIFTKQPRREYIHIIVKVSRTSE
ncbi:hypothetical protein F5887DRAFT_1135823 [Amanita rubescens]|nr:hypothetical protein F5887DRAFT_1135823 [Amanita rubescens]